MNFNNYSTLEIIEEWATDNGLIDSEETLSARFDGEFVQLVIDQYSEDDTVAINKAFNDWSDSLCKAGEIHSEQYNNYCYIGKYSEEAE